MFFLGLIMAKGKVIAFSSCKEGAIRAVTPSPDSKLHYSVLLQGTFDSAAAREEFLQVFSRVGCKFLSCAVLFPDPAKTSTECQKKDGISRALSKFMENQKHGEVAE